MSTLITIQTHPALTDEEKDALSYIFNCALSDFQTRRLDPGAYVDKVFPGLTDERRASAIEQMTRYIRLAERLRFDVAATISTEDITP
jgi:hypothetical protein